MWKIIPQKCQLKFLLRPLRGTEAATIFSLFLGWGCCICIAKGRWHFKKLQSVEQWDAATNEAKICILQYWCRSPRRRLARCHFIKIYAMKRVLARKPVDNKCLFRVVIMIVNFRTFFLYSRDGKQRDWSPNANLKESRAQRWTGTNGSFPASSRARGLSIRTQDWSLS